MKRAAIIDLYDVSRETSERLDIYVRLLKAWQKKINLVSKTTLEDVWSRHIADGLQAANYLKAGRVADFGTGGGVPGLIFALMGLPEVTIVESDTRKMMFLRTVLRETGQGATFLNQRVEHVDPLHAQTITGRAFAPLPKFLSLALAHLEEQQGSLLIHKGKNFAAEVDDAQRDFSFNVRICEAAHHSDGVLLEVTKLRPL